MGNKKKLYKHFKLWIATKYSSDSPSHEQWKDIVEEDIHQNYASNDADEELLQDEIDDGNEVQQTDGDQPAANPAIFYEEDIYDYT